jgi:hypothetical protein
MRNPLPIFHGDTASLKQRIQQEHDGHKKPRLQMLYWLASGPAQTRQNVAQFLEVHRHTIGHWRAIDATGGLAALLAVSVPAGNPVSLPRSGRSSTSSCGSMSMPRSRRPPASASASNPLTSRPRCSSSFSRRSPTQTPTAGTFRSWITEAPVRPNGSAGQRPPARSRASLWSRVGLHAAALARPQRRAGVAPISHSRGATRSRGATATRLQSIYAASAHELRISR